MEASNFTMSTSPNSGTHTTNQSRSDFSMGGPSDRSSPINSDDNTNDGNGSDEEENDDESIAGLLISEQDTRVCPFENVK